MLLSRTLTLAFLLAGSDLCADIFVTLCHTVHFLRMFSSKRYRTWQKLVLHNTVQCTLLFGDENAPRSTVSRRPVRRSTEHEFAFALQWAAHADTAAATNSAFCFRERLQTLAERLSRTRSPLCAAPFRPFAFALLFWRKHPDTGIGFVSGFDFIDCFIMNYDIMLLINAVYYV